MQSVDEFKPSTTEPVFGSGLISPTKISQQTNDDTEKVIPPPSEPIVINGQNDSAVNKITSNGTSENIGAGDSSAVHVNGESQKEPVETINEVKPVEEPIPAPVPIEDKPTEPESVISIPMDTTTNEGSSSTTTPPPSSLPPPPPAVETTVPEIVETEPKGKSTRGKPKPAAVPITPTRQSARGRKTASSSSTNVEENQTTEESSQPKDVIPTNNQSNLNNDEDVMETEKVSSSGGKKRALTNNAAKTTKGKKSITSIDDEGESGAATSEVETIQTPPKKARTSANKKTPEPPSEDYVRKLRPRK